MWNYVASIYYVTVALVSTTYLTILAYKRQLGVAPYEQQFVSSGCWWTVATVHFSTLSIVSFRLSPFPCRIKTSTHWLVPVSPFTYMFHCVLNCFRHEYN